MFCFECVFTCSILFMFFFYVSGDHRDLHVLTHSFPTRRSSDLSDAIAGVINIILKDDTSGAAMMLGGVTGAGDGVQGRYQLDKGFAFGNGGRSEEHTSELQSLMRISYAVFCLKKKTQPI